MIHLELEHTYSSSYNNYQTYTFQHGYITADTIENGLAKAHSIINHNAFIDLEWEQENRMLWSMINVTDPSINGSHHVSCMLIDESYINEFNVRPLEKGVRT